MRNCCLMFEREKAQSLSVAEVTSQARVRPELVLSITPRVYFWPEAIVAALCTQISLQRDTTGVLLVMNPRYDAFSLPQGQGKTLHREIICLIFSLSPLESISHIFSIHDFLGHYATSTWPLPRQRPRWDLAVEAVGADNSVECVAV